VDIDEVEMKLYNMLGMEIFNSKYKEKNIQIDLSSYGVGIYLLNIKNGKKSIVKKIQIIR
jgi:hypothetical protein